MANKTMHHTVIGPDTFELVDQSARADVGDLKNAFDSIIDTPENYFDGQFVFGEEVSVDYGTFISNSSYSRTDYIPVKAGVVNIGMKSSSSVTTVFTHYCLYNASKTKVSSGTYSGITVNTADDMKYQQLTVAQEGYLVFDISNSISANKFYVSQKSIPTKYVAYYHERIETNYVYVDKTLTEPNVPADSKIVGDKIAIVNDNVVTIKNQGEPTTLSTTWTEGSYINKYGGSGSNSGYKYSADIPVENGDIITSDGTIAFVCAKRNGVVDSTAGHNNDAGSNTYIVPNGITSIIISCAKTVTGFYKASVIATSGLYPTEAVNTIRGGYLSTVYASSLTAGNGMYSVRNSIIRNNKIEFMADVSGSSWQVLIAHGVVNNDYDSNAYSEGYIVTPTQLIPWSNGKNGQNGTTGTAWNHGLTIGSRLNIEVAVDRNQKSKVRIMSEEGFVEKEYDSLFSGRKGNVYAYSIAGTFTNCGLTFTCADIEAPVWMFGDSYVSIVQERYPYWLIQNDFDRCLINSYPGEASPNAIKDLRELLKIGTPKYIVWGLGMNDHDSSSAPNADWLASVTELLQICNDRHIIPILATIPNVTDTAYNNVQKNAWVKSHDYRYVDFAKAIGAVEEVGATWPEGWLNSDNVHPTAKGARVLAMQFMVDVPEAGTQQVN